MNEVTCDYNALVLALRLALTAETEEKAENCVFLAEEISARMSPGEIEEAKHEARGKPAMEPIPCTVAELLLHDVIEITESEIVLPASETTVKTITIVTADGTVKVKLYMATPTALALQAIKIIEGAK